MFYTQDVGEFVRKNHAEVTRLTSKICNDYGIGSYSEDLVENLYTRIIVKDILKTYNPHHPGSPKISTYLYRIIVNMVKAHITDPEQKIKQSKYKIPDLSEDSGYDMDRAIEINGLHTEYQNTLCSNYTNETPDGLSFDLDMFEKYLKKTNRSFTLERRKGLKVDETSLSLLQVFSLMRKGYPNKFIAHKFGVSNTFITTLKVEIKLQMIKFGFIWGLPKKSR